jgi:hypothetical protein
LPTYTSTTDLASGSFWVLRNNTSTYLSITVTNSGNNANIGNIVNPLVIPPGNSTIIVLTSIASGTFTPNYILF